MRTSRDLTGRVWTPAKARLAPLAAPTVLFAAHLVGGASSPVLAAIATVAMGLTAASTLLGTNKGFSPLYLKRLAWPAAWFFALIFLSLISLNPVSQGWRHGLEGGRLDVSTLSIDPPATWVEILKLLGLSAAFLAARPIGADHVKMRIAIRAMVAFGALWAAWAFVLFIAGTDHNSVPRLARPFVSPNVAAAWISVTLLCSVLAMRGRIGLTRERGFFTMTAVPIGLLLVTCLLLTGSRSAILIMVSIGGCALLATWLGGIRRRGRLAPTLPSIVAVTGVLVFAGIVGIDLSDRFIRLGPDAIDRWSIVNTYAEAARQSPWFGYGLGSAPRLSRLLLVAENEAAFWNIRAVHNLPVQWWLETGFVGLAFGSMMMAALLWATIRGLSRRAFEHMWPILMVSVLLLAQGMVDYAAQIYSVSLSWAFLLGLAFSTSTAEIWRSRRLKRAPPDMPTL